VKFTDEGRGVVDDAQGFLMDEGLMLHEGSHRSCAIYESGITDFEVIATLHPVFESWSACVHPGLRNGTA
jgi:hypothetical protein